MAVPKLDSECAALTERGRQRAEKLQAFIDREDQRRILEKRREEFQCCLLDEIETALTFQNEELIDEAYEKLIRLIKQQKKRRENRKGIPKPNGVPKLQLVESGNKVETVVQKGIEEALKGITININLGECMPNITGVDGEKREGVEQAIIKTVQNTEAGKNYSSEEIEAAMKKIDENEKRIDRLSGPYIGPVMKKALIFAASIAILALLSVGVDLMRSDDSNADEKKKKLDLAGFGGFDPFAATADASTGGVGEFSSRIVAQAEAAKKQKQIDFEEEGNKIAKNFKDYERRMDAGNINVDEDLKGVADELASIEVDMKIQNEKLKAVIDKVKAKEGLDISELPSMKNRRERHEFIMALIAKLKDQIRKYQELSKQAKIDTKKTKAESDALLAQINANLAKMVNKVNEGNS